MIELGAKVKDKISGFTGIVVGYFEYLNNCIRCCVRAEQLEGGKLVEETFDVEDLELVQPEAAEKATRPTGGPRPEPSRPSPTR